MLVYLGGGDGNARMRPERRPTGRNGAASLVAPKKGSICSAHQLRWRLRAEVRAPVRPGIALLGARGVHLALAWVVRK
jgi:hypothetical protein